MCLRELAVRTFDAQRTDAGTKNRGGRPARLSSSGCRRKRNACGDPDGIQKRRNLFVLSLSFDRFAWYSLNLAEVVTVCYHPVFLLARQLKHGLPVEVWALPLELVLNGGPVTWMARGSSLRVESTPGAGTFCRPQAAVPKMNQPARYLPRPQVAL